MKTDVSIKFRDVSRKITVDIPSTCPHCGIPNSPEVFSGWSRDNLNESHVQIGFLAKCTFEECEKYYALSYNYIGNRWNLIDYSYSPAIHVELPENIEKVSPNFVEIYSQATIAESSKLDQIAGVGYRKSLEFLIKDYAIKYNQDKESEIKTMFLFPCIQEYLGDFKRLQALATAATWIGNDETHYERRHTNHDIQSMKKFIRSASQYIAAEYDADDAIEFIES